jgi:hypothetical protein
MKSRIERKKISRLPGQNLSNHVKKLIKSLVELLSSLIQSSNMTTITFKGQAWDEKPYEEIGSGAKLSKVSVKQEYTGDMTGTSTIEYLMSYTTTGTCSFVGYERFTGKLGGKSGSFVLQHVGKWENGEAKSSFSVVEGASTDDLVSLRGSGNYAAKHKEDPIVTFNYALS